ncbi:MAG: hypothetical protein IIA88_02410 [Bacteroidetes bacterium]|nr:hypothetical protein [Bacteroidota bacterium]
MRESVFNSKLLKDGHLYCPKKFTVKDAKFKVIISIPQDNAIDSEIEMASTIDNQDDFLTEEEIKYYLQNDIQEA